MSMDGVECTGGEMTLEECPFDSWDIRKCSLESAGVRCGMSRLLHLLTRLYACIHTFII